MSENAWLIQRRRIAKPDLIVEQFGRRRWIAIPMGHCLATMLPPSGYGWLRQRRRKYNMIHCH